MGITFKQFKTHINHIQNMMHLQDDLNALARKNNLKTSWDWNITFPTLVDDVVSLLQTITHDDGEWISYWIFELCCGKKYEDGSVTAGDGSIIKLRTIEDLWKLLCKNRRNK